MVAVFFCVFFHQVLIDKETSVQGLRELMLVNVKLEALPKLVLLTRGRPIGKHANKQGKQVHLRWYIFT